MDELWKFTAYVYFVQKDGEHIFYNDYMNFIWNSEHWYHSVISFISIIESMYFHWKCNQ